MSISVEETGGPEPMEFAVAVTDGGGRTEHSVTMTQEDHARLAQGAAADQVIKAAFAFLLDREPKEAILASFDITAIARYFPEFEEKLPDYLASA